MTPEDTNTNQTKSTTVGDAFQGVSLQEVAGKNFVTLRTASRLIGCTYQTAMRYVNPKPVNGVTPEPKIKAYRVGNQWRITEEEMKKFLSGGITS